MSSARHGRAPTPSHPGAVGIAGAGGGRPPSCPVGVKVEVTSRGVDDPGSEPGGGDGCRNGDSGFPGRRKISLLNGFDSPELMETRESPRGKEPADDASGADAAEPIADGQPPTKPSLGADGWGRAVSSSIDVPKSRTGWNEPKMDHVMAAMVLTSLSSSCPTASPGSLTMPAFNAPDAPLPSEPAPKFFCASSWPEHDATSVSCGGSDDGRGGGGGASCVAECGWDASSTDRRSQPSTPSPKPLALDAILPFRFESGSSEQRGDDDLTAGRQQQQQPQQQPQRQQQPPQQQRQRVKHEADMAGRCRGQPQPPPPPPPSFLATSGAAGKCAAHGAVVASFARPALKAKEPKAASKTFFNGSQARGISGTLPARLPPSSEHAAPPPLPACQADSTWEARGAGGTATAGGGGQPPPVFLCGAARGGGADGVSGGGAGFRVANVRISEDGDMEGGSFLDEPSPRKRKNSLKVMFQCMWPNCEKVLSTASGMQRHIRRLHLGRNSDSDLSDGEEDFYYSEMEVNMDSLTDGLSSLAPVSPTAVIAPPVFPAPSPPPPPPPPLHPSGVCRSHSMAGKREPHPPTQLSRSAPTSFWHPVHTDHAYQACGPLLDTMSPPGAGTTFGTLRLQLEGATAACDASGFPMRVRTLSSSEHRPPGTPGAAACRLHASLSPSPKSLAPGRKSRGEAKKCRKVYGMENKDMWCTACRWKKACQRFND
ncbi:uncharacterized protein LOC116941655 isoform X1 [Petromyzon marinus]|uniref:uncharacterized protein LOC116941655 isoform X1 n=3 Tax=Petromyzon marinus TaxID=7757 RepID=UPI003F6ED4D1